MLTEISKVTYRSHFTEDPHPYVTEGFIDLVKQKTEKVVHLITNEGNISLGLIAGLKDNELSAPFSAPFGGFHYTHDDVFYSEIFNFLAQLKEYAVDQHLNKMSFILPPNIYNSSINAKFVNAFVRQGYTLEIPDLVSWIDLNRFDGTWKRKRIAENCKSAIKNNLTFSLVTDEKSMQESYEVIVNNRTQLGREIFMSFDDLMNVNRLFPVDFFLVKNKEDDNIGAAIFYRGHPKIVQGIFWGDIIPRTSIGIMDFLVFNLFIHYKNLGFDYIDLALSSKSGIPNEGLIRFKETHQCTSSLRYTITWTPEI